VLTSFLDLLDGFLKLLSFDQHNNMSVIGSGIIGDVFD
jgi:hypothetical protein